MVQNCVRAIDGIQRDGRLLLARSYFTGLCDWWKPHSYCILSARAAFARVRQVAFTIWWHFLCWCMLRMYWISDGQGHAKYGIQLSTLKEYEDSQLWKLWLEQ